MKIKINMEYTIQMNNGFEWIDVHEDFDGSKPLKIFHKEMVKEVNDDMLNYGSTLHVATGELVDSFNGTLERLKEVNFSYTQEME